MIVNVIQVQKYRLYFYLFILLTIVILYSCYFNIVGMVSASATF